ncbi:DUF5694 domain-containing protein [Sandaracinobacteroides hominis]|uniref:DUF5694 domain-containing protein n=1 Tax=Sandaracinobacteroides hominis TaxID=2780086 RepID=UPI001A9C5C63|nr:DUF5694 domain-containing protein [Sandaracinobacteroides hominis]
MHHARLNYLVAAATGCLLAASAQSAAFDPRNHKAPLAGNPTQVMVLGSSHLSGLPERIDANSLSLVNSRLAGWKPDRIAIEALSGVQCDFLLRNPALYPAVADNYCVETAEANAATGLDVPAANAEAARLLETWPASPTAAQRRRLALTFLAAGEPSSAVVQWLRLPPAERVAKDGLTPALASWIDGRVTRRNENYLVAAALAARLGHERVWAMDDHTSDILTANSSKAFDQAMTEIWSNPEAQARRAESTAREAKLGTPESMLALYRDDNDPAVAELAFNSDFGAAMRHQSPELYGRRYLGWWETRNLRMAGNIREIATAIPGGRLLVITGSSHKGYLDAYLQMMHDLKLESPLPLLQ